mgnify:CR=1 FL=1
MTMKKIRTRDNLTRRQRETFAWVKAFIRDHGMPPTVREIGDAFGIKSSSVFHLLKELERKGYLERGELGARSLIVKGRKRVPCGCGEVPIVGRIPAGRPVEAIEHGVLRGGSWNNGTPANFRCACRSIDDADYRLPDSGFRVARTLTP